jgi:hypothetical protein
MKKFMGLKEFGVVLLIFSAAFGYCAEKINYCGAIKFHPGIFDRKTLEKASASPDCRDIPVPLLLKGRSGYQAQQFSLSKEAPPLASYLSRNALTGKYVFDREEFERVVRDWAVFKGENLASYQYKPAMRVEKTSGGEFFSCAIEFRDFAGNLKFVKQNLAFFKEEEISAMYLSDIVDVQDRKSLEILRAIERLFFSMEID